MTEEEIEQLNDSFERCVSDEEFMEVFYQDFLANPPVAEKFANTDLRRQKRMVKASLHMMISAVSRRQQDLSYLGEIAERHSRRGVGIQPYLYELWMQSLLRAVRHCDRRCNTAIETLWRQALDPAIEFIVAKY